MGVTDSDPCCDPESRHPLVPLCAEVPGGGFGQVLVKLLLMWVTKSTGCSVLTGDASTRRDYKIAFESMCTKVVIR